MTTSRIDVERMNGVKKTPADVINGEVMPLMLTNLSFTPRRRERAWFSSGNNTYRVKNSWIIRDRNRANRRGVIPADSIILKFAKRNANARGNIIDAKRLDSGTEIIAAAALHAA